MAKELYQLIREKFQLGPALHMTHIENLAWIIQSGALRSFNKMRGHNYVNLGNDDVQNGRSLITVMATGRNLHDYVPLYFGFKTPMVAVNQNRNAFLVFLRFSLDIFELGGVVISDGNARSLKTRFVLYRNINDLKILNVKAINTLKYSKDKEIKREKQAELLVPDELSINHLLDIICYSKEAQSNVTTILKKSGINRRVLVNKGWYFIQREDQF